jgi:hypothetical protein
VVLLWAVSVVVRCCQNDGCVSARRLSLDLFVCSLPFVVVGVSGKSKQARWERAFVHFTARDFRVNDQNRKLCKNAAQ